MSSTTNNTAFADRLGREGELHGAPDRNRGLASDEGPGQLEESRRGSIRFERCGPEAPLPAIGGYCESKCQVAGVRGGKARVGAEVGPSTEEALGEGQTVGCPAG